MRLFHRTVDAEPIAAGEALDRFFASLDDLDDGQLLALGAAWRGVDRQAHEAAWTTVREVASAGRLTHGVDAVRDRAMHWSTRADNQPPQNQYLVDSQTSADIRAGAGAAIVDAALAIALGERLDPRTRQTLLGPWEAAIGSLEPDAR